MTSRTPYRASEQESDFWTGPARRRRPYDLSMTELDLRRFSWHRESQTLTTEESTLRNGPRTANGEWFLSRMYNDACDVGIAIRSHKTGTVERFYLTTTDQDSEGDIAGWNFEPENELCPVKHVLIIND